jgi:hypothetical protein
MPFRLNEFRAKIQFIAPARFPSLIYKACLATDTVSNTRYIQEAVVTRLARDLGIDEQELLDELPTPRGPAGVRMGPDRRPVPIPSRPNEEVR